MAGVPLVEIEHVSKTFDGTQALRDVSLTIDAGEFVGLVGPNGAGKSTLVKILDGVHAPDSGVIRLGGKARTGGRGRLRGIGVVHQDLGIVGTLSVADNLRLGLPPLLAFGPVISHRREREFAAEALRSVGLSPDYATRTVETLSLGEQTLVAIARTIAIGAEVVVVDEATSALSPTESQWLLEMLRRRTADGVAVLMVSHKMSEIMDTTDRCIVIVDGRVAADVATAETDLARIGRLMSPGISQDDDRTEGGVPDAGTRPGTPPADDPADDPYGDVVLELAGAHGPKAGPYDLTLHAGEIIGITGLVGSGLHDLAMVAAGVEPVVAGERRAAPGVRVGLLPPDRTAQANFAEQTAAWNLTVGCLDRWRTRSGLLNLQREHRDVGAQHRALGVRPDDPRHLHGALSGGNQQKVILGRALLQGNRCLVLCEPTRGVDVRTRREIYRLIREAASDGNGVLVVSSDAEDLLALAHRVGVVRDGRLDELSRVGDLATDELAGLL